MIVRTEHNGWDSHGTMTIDLEKLCDAEDEYWSDDYPGGFNHKRKGVKTYPLPKVKKIFKIIAEEGDPEQFDDILKYLNSRSKKYAALFKSAIGR